MAEQDFNKYTPIDVPDVPTGDINAIIEQQGRAAASASNNVTPLSDPTNNLPTPGTEPFGGDLTPFDLPGVSTKKHLFGYPDQTPGGFGVASSDDIANWIQSTNRNISNTVPTYAETFMYDAGPKTNSFYKRYAAYGDDIFSEVGFHPFVDNEANFVQRTTMADDWSRMLTHSFPVLLKRGFIDGPKSLFKALSGNFTGADLEDSREYAEAAAIGQSSREGGLTGFSAFMNNTVMNFGYTAGIISEALLEEVALSFMTIGSRGATAGVQATRSAQLGDNILKALGKFGTGYKTFNKILPKLAKSPSAARGKWTALRSAGRILNPLENTVDAAKAIRANRKAFNAGKTSSYINLLGIGAKTAGAFYRDVRAINMAVSEARLEAGMVENDIYKDIYDDFYKKNQRTPTLDEEVGMRIRAKQGSLETFYANTGIIYVTNQITFRNVVAPRGGIRNFLKGVQQDLKSFDGPYGSLGKIVYDRGKNAVKFQKNKIKALAKAWWREPGVKTVKKTLGYLKANFAEGFQENLQETIARANVAHYSEMYKTEGVSSALFAKGVNGVTYSAQMSTPADKYWDEFTYEMTSKQGLETFASGFMMGFFAKPLNNAVPFFSKHFNRIFDKEGYQQWIKTKAREQKKVVDYLNYQISKEGMSQFLNNRLLNLAVQEESAQILKYGDKKTALDAIVDSFAEQVSIMREYNAEDIFIEKLESMLELSDAELADAVQSLDEEQAPKYRERINKAITMMKEIGALSKDAENLFPNPVPYNTIDFSPEGLKDVENVKKMLLHKAWNTSVKNFIYINAAFKDTAKRMDSVYADYMKGSALANADYGAVKVLFKDKDVDYQLDILQKELENEKPNSKKGRQIKKQIDLLKDWQTKRQAFNAVYNIDENFNFVTATILKALEDIDGKKRTASDITDAEILQGKEQWEKSVTPEIQDKVDQELKDAHDNYISYLAEINDSTIFQTNLDDAFTKLLDFYKLKFENRFLAESIDTLTDPGQFLELVEKNANALQKFFNSSKDVNNDLVKKQSNEVAFDALVKKLDAIGLHFTNDEDLLNLKNNNTIPTTLKGKDDNVIFESGTPEYNAGLELINQYLGIIREGSTSTNPVTGEDMTEAMTEAITKLNALFALSKDFDEFNNRYFKDSVQFSRVSNVVKEFIGEEFDYKFIPEIVTNEDSYFAKIFKSKDKFNFTDKTVAQFIVQIAEALTKKEINGITAEGVRAIDDELEAIVKGTERPTIKAEIEKLTKKLNEASNDVFKQKVESEIASLKKQSVLEPTEANVKKAIRAILTEQGYRVTRERGNNADAMIRDYFDPGVDFKFKNYENQITKVSFDKLFGSEGILKPLKDAQDAGDIVIFSKDLTVGSAEMSNNANVAGTMDLVIVDKQGQVYILDVKTMEPGYSNQYGQNKTIGGKKFVTHAMQLLGYSNLLFNETGLDAKTLVLPITTNQDNNGKIITVGQPTRSSAFILSKADTIVPGKLFVDVNRQTKGKNTKILLGEEARSSKSVVDINDIDTLIPRTDSKSQKPGSKEKPETTKPFTKTGNVVVLGSKKTIDEGFITDFSNKLLYITVGVGGKKIAEDNPENIKHTDDIYAEVLKDLGFKRKEDEPINRYLYRFQKNEGEIAPLNGNRSELNNLVKEKIDALIDDGKTVITSSPDLIQFVPGKSIIITTTLSNENFTKEFDSEQAAENFLNKERVAIKNKDDISALRVEEFKQEIESTEDTITLYVGLENLDVKAVDKNKLRLMIDLKANALLNPNSSVVINTSKIYTLVKDLKTKGVYGELSLQTGDQVNVYAINSTEKTIVIKESDPSVTETDEISFEDFLKSVVEEKDDNLGPKDNENSDAVKEYLNGLNAEKNKIDNNTRDFGDFDNKTDDENFDMFKCG